MMLKNEWSEYRLDKITKFIYDCPHSTPKWKDSGVIVLRNQNIRNGRLDLSTLKFTDESGYKSRIKRALPKVGDLVLTREAPMGEVCLIPKGLQCCLGQRMVLIRADCKIIDSKYLLYIFQGSYLQSQISWNEGTGTTVSNIRIPNIQAFSIPTPSLPEQKAIAHVLGSLDERIELNRRMNETLEGMAQALFKSWFVDFDPVLDNALASGKEIPPELKEKAAARTALANKAPLPKEIRTLFPDEFSYSDELGWIPKGWDTGKYCDVATLNPKSWTKKTAPSKVKYVDLANTKNGRINLVVPYDFTEAPSRARRILSKNDTIIGTVRPGNRSFAYIYSDGLTGSTGFAVMHPLKKYYRSFIYLSLTQDVVIEKFAHLADGAAYPAIRPEVVANSEIAIPPTDILKYFDLQVHPLISGIGHREKKSKTLSKLRDTLLPKLLSGEIRIPDAEKMVEELG